MGKGVVNLKSNFWVNQSFLMELLRNRASAGRINFYAPSGRLCGVAEGGWSLTSDLWPQALESGREPTLKNHGGVAVSLAWGPQGLRDHRPICEPDPSRLLHLRGSHIHADHRTQKWGHLGSLLSSAEDTASLTLAPPQMLTQVGGHQGHLLWACSGHASLSLSSSALPQAKQSHWSPKCVCTYMSKPAHTHTHTHPASQTWNHMCQKSTHSFRCNHPSLENDSFIVQ